MLTLRHFFAGVLILAVSVAVASQDVDELKAQLASTEGPEKVGLLNDLASSVLHSAPREAIEYGEQALELAEQYEDATGEATALLKIGIGRYFLAEYDVALEYYQRARRIAEQIDHEALLGDALSNIGIIHYVRGEYDRTLEYYEASLEMHKRLGDKRKLAASLNNLGNVYYATGSVESSLELLTESLALYEEIGDERLTASTLNNIGLAHARLGNDEEALEALERAVPIEERLGDRSGLALSLNNIGMVFEALERPEDALDKYKAALALREEIEDRQGAAISRHNVGQIQSQLGDHETALVNLHAALEQVQAMQVREMERDIYKTLSDVYERTGDTARALQYHRRFKETADLLFNEETAAKLGQLENRLEVERKDREIAALRNSEEVQRITRNVSLAGSVVLIILLVLVYSRYRLKARANEALEQANEQRERAARAELTHFSRVNIMGELATVLAHELRQPLTAMMSNAQAGRRMLASGKHDIQKVDETLADIVDAADRAREVIKRLRKLIRRGEITRERLAVDGLINEIDPFARAAARQHGVPIEIVQDPALPPVSGDRVQLQQVILNLVQNGAEAMAQTPSNGGVLQVHTSLQDPDTVLISVRDAGPGLGDEDLERIFEPFFTGKSEGLGMGLPICQSIVEAHGGRLWAERNDDRGLVVQFTVPRAGT